jgi:hypothetical protein
MIKKLKEITAAGTVQEFPPLGGSPDSLFIKWPESTI